MIAKALNLFSRIVLPNQINSITLTSYFEISILSVIRGGAYYTHFIIANR